MLWKFIAALHYKITYIYRVWYVIPLPSLTYLLIFTFNFSSFPPYSFLWRKRQSYIRSGTLHGQTKWKILLQRSSSELRIIDQRFGDCLPLHRQILSKQNSEKKKKLHLQCKYFVIHGGQNVNLHWSATWQLQYS